MTSDNDKRNDQFGIDRRNFLGAATAGALGLAATGQGVAQESDGGAENSQFAVSEHDHSGEFGASDRLGEEAPVKSIAVEDLVTENTPVVDVRAYGVVGDGETDDSAALQDAIDAATPHGVLHIPAHLKVRLESGVTANLNEGRSPGEQNRFAFLCEGAITPAPGIGHAVTIQGGMAPYVFARVEGGGQDVETDSAFYVYGSRGGLFEGWGRDYAGRIFHFEQSGTYSVGHLKAWGCGQSIAVFDASPMGEIQDVFDISPARAPEFHGSSDVCINQYENFQAEGRTERGILFEDCLSVFVDRIAVGGTADTPPAEFRDCRNMFVNALHLGGSPTWGGVIENVTNSTFRIVCNIIAKGIKYTGEDTDANRIILNGTNLAEKGLVVEDDVTGGYHYFAGNITDTSARAIDVRADDAEIHLDNFYAEGNAGGDLAVPDDNDVHLTNCRLNRIEGTPRTINGVGVSRAPSDTPDGTRWNVGTHVLFTDTDDGSGDGLYLLASDDQWVKYGDIETFEAESSRTELLVHQGNANNVPENAFDQSTQGFAAVADSIGQSFTVDRDFAEIDVKLANWGNDASAATMTLYEGSPADGNLTEIGSQRVDPVPNNQQVTLDLASESAGTYYLEMDEPEATPTWWWHEGDGVEDVGGQAFVGRQPVPEADLDRDVSQANFTIRVLG